MTLRSFELVIKAKVPDNLHEEDILSIIKRIITGNFPLVFVLRVFEVLPFA
jgi:hypothetical protein